MARQNYLNNKDFLAEIHKSKSTFCSYTADEYAMYDIILGSIDEITPRTIVQARRNRAARLQKEAHAASTAEGKKTKLADHLVKTRTIPKTDLVFRIMTFDHIPLDPKRKKNPKTIADQHTKLNFPPFQHWAFRPGEDTVTCVGKSHWEGGVSNGWFNKEHGRMTEKLGRMFMKLCDRYGGRYNWKDYSYNDEMRLQSLLQLSQIGLQFDESKSQNPFAYYTAAITNSFTRVLNIEKKNHAIRDDILEMNNLTPSYTRQGQAHNEAWQAAQDANKPSAQKEKN